MNLVAIAPEFSLIKKIAKKKKKRKEENSEEWRQDTKQKALVITVLVSGTDWILRASQFPVTVLFPLASLFIPSEPSALWSKPTKNNMTLRLTNKEIDHGIPMKYNIK